MVEDIANGRASGHPHVAQVLSRTVVFGVFWPVTPDVCQRAVEGAHDIGNRDVGRLTRQPVAAIGPPLAGDDACLAQLPQDSLEKPGRDVLCGGEVVTLDQRSVLASRAITSSARMA